MGDDKVEVNVFPSNPNQALALLYVQKHLTTETKPEELYAMYMEAEKKIRLSHSKMKALMEK